MPMGGANGYVVVPIRVCVLSCMYMDTYMYQGMINPYTFTSAVVSLLWSFAGWMHHNEWMFCVYRATWQQQVTVVYKAARGPNLPITCPPVYICVLNILYRYMCIYIYTGVNMNVYICVCESHSPTPNNLMLSIHPPDWCLLWMNALLLQAPTPAPTPVPTPAPTPVSVYILIDV